MQPLQPSLPSPAAESMADLLARVELLLKTDWSGLFLGYHIVRSLRSIRDYVQARGWPRTFDDKLQLTLIPYLSEEARKAGLDWAKVGALDGQLAPLFEIDACVMNRGRGRIELTAQEFSEYVKDSTALFQEFSAIRARMHNGEP